MAAQQHLYIVTYDIGDPKRWRKVFRFMKGYGEWLQLSVFQCRLSRKQHAEMQTMLDSMIHHTDDHVLIINVGPAESIKPSIVSLGKEFSVVERQPVIV